MKLFKYKTQKIAKNQILLICVLGIIYTLVVKYILNIAKPMYIHRLYIIAILWINKFKGFLKFVYL